MPRLEFRGPLLLLFALAQQQSSLLQSAMAAAPLTPTDFAIYSALRLMQPTTPTQLAATLGMRATTVSSALVRMSANGHLQRRRNPADGRSVVVMLNRAGIRATEACFPAFQTAIEAFRRHLDIDEAQLLDAFEAASRALAAAAGELAGTDAAEG